MVAQCWEFRPDNDAAGRGRLRDGRRRRRTGFGSRCVRPILHHVRLRPYWLSETEIPWTVVVAYWDDVPQARPDHPEVPEDLNLPASLSNFQAWTGLFNWVSGKAKRSPYYDERGNPPSSADSGRFGDSLRLPTEAEMEFALRQSSDPEGPLPGPLPVSQVAQDSANFRGLRGNFWELCGDWLAPYNSNIIDDPMGPGETPPGSLKVIRGGRYTVRSSLARSVARGGQDSSQFDPDVGWAHRDVCVPMIAHVM